MTTVSTELAKLAAISKRLERRNDGLPFDDRRQSWRGQSLAAISLFLLGGVCGILLEKRQTTDSLASIYGQIECIQISANPAVKRPVTPERQKRAARTR